MISEQEFKNRIAERLVYFRKQNNLTQLELANKLNYSDKAVSKWERGENIPDVYVLHEIATLYGVTINDFICENPKKISPSIEKKLSNRTKFIIGLISFVFVFFVATVVYAILRFATNYTKNLWWCFIFAIPVASTVGLVLNWKWGNRMNNIWFVSGIDWGLVLSLFFSLHISDLWILFAIGGFFQILIIIWFWLVKTSIQKKKIASMAKELQNENVEDIGPDSTNQN